jgi:citrate lyase subunit beta/citryl-CoA lyase
MRFHLAAKLKHPFNLTCGNSPTWQNDKHLVDPLHATSNANAADYRNIAYGLLTMGSVARTIPARLGVRTTTEDQDMRVSRSILSIPASNPRMIEKGLASSADIAFLDLEDAVAPNMKAEARKQAIDTLNDADWLGKPRAVRINPVGSAFFARDLIDLVEQAGRKLDLVILPKVDRPADLLTATRLLDGLEPGLDRALPIGIEAQIESAIGLARCEETAISSPRLESLVFGPGDFAASLRMPGRAIGVRDEWDRDYAADRLHYPLMRILVAARSAGIRAIDGPYSDFRDAEGLKASARRSKALGFDGKWCIHPSQIETVNAVFSPDDEEIAAAQALVEAYEASMTAGSGAAIHEGVMIDAASVRMARAVLGIAERVQSGAS